MPAAACDTPLVVSMGEPAGIGPDIILSAWAGRSSISTPLPPFVVLADPDMLAARARDLGLDMSLAVATSLDATWDCPPDRLPVIRVALQTPCVAGQPDPRNAGAVIAAIEQAVAWVATGKAAGLVTAPIAKSVLYAAGFAHPGHTEFLGELARRYFPGSATQPVMMLADDCLLRVVPVTVHIPLAEVPRALTAELIATTCRITARDLGQRFGIARPRLAVAGVNPHAGEGGTIGREDVEVIAPAIATLRAEGFEVSGPHSADTMFHAGARATYDAAICMYHDQALIPIKTLAFDTGVNVTLGLPFVRTSPDHGTAFDIAGTGKARATSFVAALCMAGRMTAHAASHSS